jgi:glycosyltransferase involved in cell wall biosynthesis
MPHGEGDPAVGQRPGRPPAANGIGVLVGGWMNTPHVTGWATGIAELGYDVHLAGHAVDGWPDEPPAGLASVHRLTASSPPPLRGLQLGRQFGRVARELAPDLVHAHWLPEYGWMAARERLSPLVVSAWGSDVLGAGRLGRSRSRRAIEAADLVLADSAALADAVRALARRPVRVEVVHWGIDLVRFAPRADRAAARRALGWEEAPTVLSTRALGAIYNPLVLLRAFAELRRELPAARLVLKHPGAAVPAPVTAELDRLALRDGVAIVGHVDAARLPGLYRAADVAISIPSSDSSPRSAWEALASGVPLVVSDLPWARDELSGAARLVAPQPAAVAAALRELLTDAAEAQRLARAGRARAEAAMDRRVHLARVDALYRELLGR